MSRMEIAYLGPEGSYHSYVADYLIERFGGEKRSIEGAVQLCRAAAEGDVAYSLLAVETNLCGMIEPHVRAFLDSDLTISGEVAYRAHMTLAGQPGSTLSGITRVHSHPEALAECRDWLRGNLPNATVMYASSTGAAARSVSLGDAHDAVICSPRTVARLGFQELADDVCDAPGDLTRFWLLGARNDLGLDADVTSVLVTPYGDDMTDLLRVLAAAPVPISRVDAVTRRRGLGEYSVHVDIRRQPGDEGEAFHRELASVAEIRVLGSYADLTS